MNNKPIRRIFSIINEPPLSAFYRQEAMKQAVRNTKTVDGHRARPPPAMSISAALLVNASCADPTNSSIPSSLRNFEAGIMDAPISATTSTEAFMAEDKRRPVPLMPRHHCDTTYPAVRGHRGRFPSTHAEPGAEKRSSTKFWLHVGVAIVLTASVASILNMMLETADSEESEPPNRVQPKQAASSASANHSGNSNPTGTTADNIEATMQTQSNEVRGNPQTVTLLNRPTWHSDTGVDNASIGGVNTRENPANESTSSDDWVEQEALGLTSQGLGRREGKPGIEATTDFSNLTEVMTPMPAVKYSELTTVKLYTENNDTGGHKKLSKAQAITQAARKSSQNIHATKIVGISLCVWKDHDWNMEYRRQ
ncbi:hypothetical protein HPB48_000025 [Haemaphysalis longicornis]|uniref:Uncharacterized protein n=1 Tax=Haemaphysalis longicornis TaxID=44386 RepID=A0A9J6FP21_HAELO|nr:hypothetical protein HPB48_000025 [Haemaphysalis longicornis]